MNCAIQKRRARWRMGSAVPRGIWALLALIHIAPLLSTTRTALSEESSSAAAANCLLVWLAFVFFVLKCVDAPFLRWRFSRAGVLTFVLVCGLAHRDVRAAADSGFIGELPGVVATAVACEALVRHRRLLPRILDRIRFSITSLERRIVLAIIHFRRQHIPAWADCRIQAISRVPRAPPC
jgi:hypothetical protein